MGIHGELFTTQVALENRTYFFNVKENRSGDVFLQIVESKKGDGSDFSRLQISIFAEDMPRVLKGLDESLKFIEKNRKEKAKIRAEKKAAKEARFSKSAKSSNPNGKKIVKRKSETKQDDGIKRTGKVIHIVSKREDSDSSDK